MDYCFTGFRPPNSSLSTITILRTSNSLVPYSLSKIAFFQLLLLVNILLSTTSKFSSFKFFICYNLPVASTTRMLLIFIIEKKIQDYLKSNLLSHSPKLHPHYWRSMLYTRGGNGLTI